MYHFKWRRVSDDIEAQTWPHVRGRFEDSTKQKLLLGLNQWTYHFGSVVL